MNRPLSRPPFAAAVGSSSPERYEVLGLIASGGVGSVYRVKDRVTGRVLALKRLGRESLRDPAAREAFEREYQILAGLSHPRIIRVFDYGLDASGPYYTMELVDGTDMAEAAPLPYRQCCMYLRDVATSLALLHARRLVHRDVSATNVRVTASGECKLLDFGTLAPFGYAGMIAGTPPFIAPEAVFAGSIDHRADLFALGALAYWMLTARHAYPAKRLEDLRALWRMSLPPPSSFAPSLPAELDALVLSLLAMDPLARPTSAAEVIAALEVIGQLPAEQPADVERLAQSYLANPRFVGRKEELQRLVGHLDRAFEGQGAALRLEAIPGMGRTRLLDELGLRAQVKGALVLRVDATAHRQPLGVARALALLACDLVPELARDAAGKHRGALGSLGRHIDERLGTRASERTPRAPAKSGASAANWFEEISRARPLLLAVDDVECTDEASFGLLTSLASIASCSRVLLLVTERTTADANRAVGLRALRAHCESIVLPGLTAADALELTRSIFGDAPNGARYAEWIHERTAGSALHFIEISRRLASERVARYVGGAWALPAERPDSAPPEALEDALAVRLGALGEKARELAECLGLQRARRPTLELCRLLLDEPDRPAALSLLDELERQGVLYAEAGGYRFSSLALSEALQRGMSPARRARNHRRLGAALLALSPSDPGVLVEAGWHMIQGGEELAGAELIADATSDGPVTIRLLGNLQRLGPALEAALHVLERRAIEGERKLSLLAALVYASYYEDRRWAELYGDQALAAVANVCGLETADRLTKIVGARLGLGLGVLVAYARFRLGRDRGQQTFSGSFARLFGVAATLSGVASLSFDFDRVRRVAKVLSPFAVLPEKAAPVGMHQYCLALAGLDREEPSTDARSIDRLIVRFENPDFYPTLPMDARRLFVAGLKFARGTFAVFSSDASSLSRCADGLDETGLKLYAMIASQLRALYHANRGEFAIAAQHREQVELHAAHVGSAWQAEIWESAALLAAYTNAADVAGLMRITDALAAVDLYPRLSRHALRIMRGDRSAVAAMLADPDVSSPKARAFLGWSIGQGLLARAYNQAGEHAKAKAVCESALAFSKPADLEYIVLFLTLEIEMAHAEAHLGDVDRALSRIDRMLALPDDGNQLVKGLLYEARAVICSNAGRTDAYAEAVTEVERALRTIGTPALIAKCERFAARSEPGRTAIPFAGCDRPITDEIVTVAASSFPESA